MQKWLGSQQQQKTKQTNKQFILRVPVCQLTVSTYKLDLT